MKHAFRVEETDTFGKTRPVTDHRTREKAVKFIEEDFPQDLMGSVVLSIREIWTDKNIDYHGE